MNALVNTLLRWRETTFIVFIALAMVGFPFSEALVSISSGLLFIQALLSFSISPATRTSKSYSLLVGFFLILLVYVGWMVFTNDWQLALYELKKVLFWFILPAALFLSPSLSRKKAYSLLFLFLAAVIVASLIFSVKLFLLDYSESSSIRSIGFISNIRFSFQVILAIILLIWFLIFSKYEPIRKYHWAFIISAIWLILYLFVLKSLIGLIAFFGTVTISALIYLLQVKNRSLRYGFLTLFIIAALSPIAYVGFVARQFYTYHEVDRSSIDWITPAGNSYHHDFEQTVRENGHLVYLYIAEEELREAWNKKGSVPYDTDLNGFPLGSTLVRYMTSKGLRKDSTDFAQLSIEDIRNVEQGITNYKFVNRTFSIYPRIYETLWELEQYRSTGDPNNKSLVQRLEFLKASWILVQQNPWWGVGTGNWMSAYNSVYETSGSKLAMENRRSSHNQYLNYLVKFGSIGFIIILMALLYVFIKGKFYTNFILLHFCIAITIANFGDANLETHMGLSFFVFFCAYIAWYLPESTQKSIS